ncbi:hypothetical protein QYE76_042532 [Lolium multiflorum]|uniref:DUF4283 domain-containing protein n=1 Tax=Lolium multiflorum TaxID=4521 RepID=A0AAD8TFE9_LOLMU|nr:hypothetical protein QYE76_042532 [Lolium multiflorum]
MWNRNGRLFLPLSESNTSIREAFLGPRPSKALPTVWVQLTGLPSYMIDKERLMAGTTMIGRPVDVDELSLKKHLIESITDPVSSWLLDNPTKGAAASPSLLSALMAVDQLVMAGDWVVEKELARSEAVASSPVVLGHHTDQGNAYDMLRKEATVAMSLAKGRGPRTDPVKLSIVPIGGIHIFIGKTIDSDGNALVEALGNSDAPDQQEAVGDSDASGQEEAGNKEESILGNLSPTSDDASSMNTEEYDRALKELGDPEALEAKMKEMLATAKNFANTAAAMLDERKEAAHFVDNFLKKEREVDESLEKVKQLRKHWEDKMRNSHAEIDRIRREAIPPCKITFATPTEQQPLTTPNDNMKKAAELLKKKDEEIDINYVRMLVASAMKQRARQIGWNPTRITVYLPRRRTPTTKHRDDESRTGSTERRRRTKQHPNPIPVPSESSPKDPAKGKGSMYAGKYKYRNPSPPPRIPRPPPPPRRRSPAGNTRPHGPGGINIHDNVPPPRNRNTEREPEPRRIRNNDREPAPRRIRNEEHEPSHAEAGTTDATDTKRNVATEVGVSRGKSAGNLQAEAKSHSPSQISSPPPGGGGGGGGGGPALAQKPQAAARVMHGNVSTSTKPTTLAQSALAG